MRQLVWLKLFSRYGEEKFRKMSAPDCIGIKLQLRRILDLFFSIFELISKKLKVLGW